MELLGTGERDVVILLLEDHEAVRALFGQLDEDAAAVATVFNKIVKSLTVHEVAEEEVVYPAILRWVDGGGDLAAARLGEHKKAEDLLARMEKMDVLSEEFGAALQELKDAVLDHAAHEEAEVFPALEAAAGPEQLRALGYAYLLAKSMAPTHPHPMVPNTLPANVLVGAGDRPDRPRL